MRNWLRHAYALTDVNNHLLQVPEHATGIEVSGSHLHGGVWSCHDEAQNLLLSASTA